MSFDVQIIGSGSSGNCIIIDDAIMIDAGLSIKRVEEVYELSHCDFLIVTHNHIDHRKLPLIRKLILQHTLCLLPKSTVNDIAEEGLLNPQHYNNIMTHDQGSSYDIETYFGQYKITTLPQKHGDIVNFAILIERGDDKLLFATDLDTVYDTEVGPGIDHLGKVDTLLLEGNFDEVYLRQTIQDVVFLETGYYLAEQAIQNLPDFIARYRDVLSKDTISTLYRASRNLRHISKQVARRFALAHVKEDGEYYEIHRSSQFYNGDNSDYQIRLEDITSNMSTRKEQQMERLAEQRKQYDKTIDDLLNMRKYSHFTDRQFIKERLLPRFPGVTAVNKQKAIKDWTALSNEVADVLDKLLTYAAEQQVCLATRITNVPSWAKAVGDFLGGDDSVITKNINDHFVDYTQPDAVNQQTIAVLNDVALASAYFTTDGQFDKRKIYDYGNSVETLEDWLKVGGTVRALMSEEEWYAFTH